MPAIVVERTETSISLSVGPLAAVFYRNDDLWFPDWFYEGRRRMLRFKDHEWMSVGHVRGGMDRAVVDGNRISFAGHVSYGATPVEMGVSIEPARHGGTGFTVESTLTPREPIELLEALTSFETPGEYDGSEDSLVVMGAQAVVHWRRARLVTPPLYEHPAWILNHREQARTVTQPWSPHLAHRIRNPDGSNARWIRFMGHPEACSFKEMFVTTTRAVGTGGGASDLTIASGQGLRGWKYIPCALNWSGAMVKDPNVLCGAGGQLRQLVTLDAVSDPGIGYDEWVYEGWERLIRSGLPEDGRVPAYEVARRQGASWAKASAWSLGVLSKDPIDILEGYLPGTRPKGHRREGYVPAQWLAPAAFQSMILGDAALTDRIVRLLNENLVAYWREQGKLEKNTLDVQVQLYPSLQALSLLGERCLPLREELERVLHRFDAQAGVFGRSNYGLRSIAASCWLLASRLYGRNAWRRRYFRWLDGVNHSISTERWWWTSDSAERDAASQIRPLGMGYAVEANIQAFDETRDQQYLQSALFFARMVMAVCYLPRDVHLCEDLDIRGWANGTNTGRDQICQIPPWETFCPMRAIAGLAAYCELPSGIYDDLWYLQRTGLAAFPAARTLKRVHGVDYVNDVSHVPIRDVASERDFYLAHPYMAYENPHDQTLLTSYQSEPIWNALVLGGTLAEASDDRVLAVVPGAAKFDFPSLELMAVHLWNPTAEAITTDLSIGGGRRILRGIRVPPRKVLRIALGDRTGTLPGCPPRAARGLRGQRNARRAPSRSSGSR